MSKKRLNKKTVIIIIVVCVLILVLALIYKLFIKKDSTENKIQNNGFKTSIRLTGKLKETMNYLGNNYTIKYYGNFLNTNKKKVKAVVEYTKSVEGFALLSNELEMHIVFKNGNLKSISKKFKMIFNMPESAFDSLEYNLVGDYSQEFVQTLEEKISDRNYYVEEYKLGNNKLKYYFLNDEIKYVRYNDELISIIRIEKTVDNDLFNIPSGYNEVGK